MQDCHQSEKVPFHHRQAHIRWVYAIGEYCFNNSREPVCYLWKSLLANPVEDLAFSSAFYVQNKLDCFLIEASSLSPQDIWILASLLRNWLGSNLVRLRSLLLQCLRHDPRRGIHIDPVFTKSETSDLA